MAQRSRIVIGMLGLDQHEMGAQVVSRLLRDAGFEVVYLGKFNTPDGLARVAIEEDADAIGISAHSWEYLDQVPELLRTLAAQDAAIPVVVGGSVITPADAATLKAAGVAEVFGPGTSGYFIVERLRALARQES